MSEQPIAGPSEFGGDAGLIQPEAKGHVLSADEELMVLHGSDSTDPESPGRVIGEQAG